MIFAILYFRRIVLAIKHTICKRSCKFSFGRWTEKPKFLNLPDHNRVIPFINIWGCDGSENQIRGIQNAGIELYIVPPPYIHPGNIIFAKRHWHLFFPLMIWHIEIFAIHPIWMPLISRVVVCDLPATHPYPLRGGGGLDGEVPNSVFNKKIRAYSWFDKWNITIIQ